MMWRSTMFWPTAMVVTGLLTLVIVAQTTSGHRSSAEAQEPLPREMPRTQLNLPASSTVIEEGQPAPATAETSAAEARRQLFLELRGKLPEFDPYRGTAYEAGPGEAAPLAEQPAELPGVSAAPVVRIMPALDGDIPLANLPEDRDRRLLFALRETAHLLDEHAEQQEWEENFAQADQLRRLADRLRRQSRQMLPGPLTSSATELPANSDSPATSPQDVGD